MTAKTLEAAIHKAIALPEAAQEQLGKELLAHIQALDLLRAELQVGVDQLDAGLGEELDIETLIRYARREHAES